VKILYLTDNDSVHNRRFLEKLAGAGHEVWHWNLTATHPLELGLGGVHSIVAARSVGGDASPNQYRELLSQMQSVIQEVRPAVVHAGPIPSAGYLAALADFHPLLLMSWGSDVLLHAERSSEWKQATEFALRKADAFFCDCTTVLRAARNYRSFTDSQVVQFPWGVKPGVFSPEGPLPPGELFAPRAKETTFICTRSWDPLYGTDVLLEGFRRARCVNRSLRLLLLGGGSLERSMRDYVESCELREAVLLVGPQPEQDLPMWFRVAKAYITCAKSDGTSISLLEAMATGLPVIVTDIPSNREWVTEPDNGWLARTGSTESVADCMLRATNLTPEQRRSIAENNQRIVAERADWDKNFSRLLEMYERLV
jgi:glycosyltransferase involved in cell wall biosynthesis